ncbi:MAG: hypothetical protein R2755_31425 [Acidimicrobiales bacterium]
MPVPGGAPRAVRLLVRRDADRFHAAAAGADPLTEALATLDPAGGGPARCLAGADARPVRRGAGGAAGAARAGRLDRPSLRWPHQRPHP